MDYLTARARGVMFDSPPNKYEILGVDPMFGAAEVASAMDLLHPPQSFLDRCLTCGIGGRVQQLLGVA